MEGAKGREDGQKQELKERKAEATSDKTLSDLEETETESSLDPGPSPDGMLDEPGEIKDAGPM